MLMRALPDITSDVEAETPATLQWVGMEEIAVPISIQFNNEFSQTVAAKTNVFVSLDAADSKGIHMSRVHLAINKLAGVECNQNNINKLLDEMVTSQGDISQQAKVELKFDAILKKDALLSGESGFQSYPVIIRAEKNLQRYSYEFELTIPYSSTCPCSASLTRQLYANAINDAFPDATIDKQELLLWAQSQQGSVATPHSQRSYAYIRLAIGESDWPDLSDLIFHFEEVIGTPVQTAVKRVDEQEFARLNANNLMFCEDAARRIKSSLEAMNAVEDYWFKVEHQESLHAHNAVVTDSKKVTDSKRKITGSNRKS
ncbi:MAG: GTP cyclohydrolase FolE2 [Candidatus Pelagadaptatus aseana]|uniref:GTP cyclohydrolase FolE2 n=1 Tax=Candidatus Pelagadaptatus aseana TaxID=3120508 RepID=UPI0039B174AE